MNKQNHILIVEDETNLGVTLNEYLNDKGFVCKHAMTCADARTIFNGGEFNPQIVLMDIQLPDGDGIELAKEFRNIRKNFLLLFLSAQNDPETKLAGLEMGAEDYITKPFDLRELTLRLNKALKSFELLSHYHNEIQVGDLKLRFKSYEIETSSGEIIPLGQKECAILEMLYAQKNTVVSRDSIIDQVWGEDAFPTNRTVDNYIVRLRKWLENDSTNSIEIKSVRGVGYQLCIK